MRAATPTGMWSLAPRVRCNRGKGRRARAQKRGFENEVTPLLNNSLFFLNNLNSEK